MDLKNIDKKYRPVPFWSWNEKLDTDETRRQIGIMDDTGHGGYFMHARGGLQTEYLGEEWFENVAAAIDEAHKRGMHAWAYDENGWPSGFADGKVNGKGEKYWQKYLRIRPIDADVSAVEPHRIITKSEKYIFYYDVNEFYVDTLDREVTEDFIREAYQPYYDRFGNSFDGFFTDEPQMSRNGIPWSTVIPEEYKKAYGEDILDSLACLFLPEEGYEDVRIKFWKLMTDLFSKNFMKPIHDFCVEHGYGFTGHLVSENRLVTQLVSNGACMPHYEYFTLPGMDWLGRNIPPCVTPMQVASAAAQNGQRQILSETFAMCGHNVGHDELKRNYEWMMVRGINLLCQHLLGYTMRGIRKRDYPPAMFYQQPWWDEYKVFNDAMSRIGMILAEGEIKVDTLLMHNMTSAWICYNNAQNNPATAPWIKERGLDTNNTYNGKSGDYYNDALLAAADIIEKKHIPYHYGDETIMERHGRVEGNKLIIGEMEYTTVVLPEHIRFMPRTEAMLEEFKKNGGIITTAEELEANGIIDNPAITYTLRELDGIKVHYFVNSTNLEQPSKITRGSYILDIESGDKLDFFGEYTFPPYGSLVVVDDGTAHAEKPADKELKLLDISGKWDIKEKSYNSLTLDRCAYWFDGELIDENGYILDVAQDAYALGRAVDIKCLFKANIEYIPEKLYLACETPDIFEIKVNGTLIDKTDCGYFRDVSFRMIDIAKYACIGENKIEMACHFEQSQKTYENIVKAGIYESEKNKLVYDMEIEAIYLVGDFAVRCDGEFSATDKDACFADGGFTVVKAEDKAALSSLEQNGYPFFSGKIVFSRKFTLDDTDYKISFNKKGVNVIKLTVNGRLVRTILWAPYTLDISEYLTIGENEIEIEILNNLRNLLGPHHLAAGESYQVGPTHFFRKKCVWNATWMQPFTDKYCFVSTGII